MRLRGAKMRVGVVVSMATLPRDQRALTRARAGHAQRAFWAWQRRNPHGQRNEASKRATDVFFWRAEVGGRGGADVEEEHDAAHSSTNANAALCGRVQGRACALVAVCVAFQAWRGFCGRPPDFLFYALTKRYTRYETPQAYVRYHGAGDPFKKYKSTLDILSLPF